MCPYFSYVPSHTDEKKKEIRDSYLTTQLLVFQPGLRPSNLPIDLEAAMAEFVNTPHCPKMVRDDYLDAMRIHQKLQEDGGQSEAAESLPREEVEPLLPSPQPRDPRQIQQDPYMAGLGARLTENDLNNMNLVTEEEEMEEHVDNTEADYAHLVTNTEEDWSRDRVLLGLTPTQVTEASKWLDLAQANTTVVDDEWQQEYRPEDLNTRQREVYDRVLGYLEAEEEEQHLIDLSGGAGTGKTRLLRTILQQAEQLSGRRDMVRVCAYTNAASSLFVGGTTVHRLFRLNVDRTGRNQCRNQQELEGLRLADLQEDMKHTKAVIIDEKSMIGCFTLWCIDQRLRQAKPKNAHLPFGGLLVVLCGDLSQLPPVGDQALYAATGKKSTKQHIGFALYQQFQESYKLQETMRQQGEENESFRQELGRLADGTFNIHDWRHWSSRELSVLSAEERERFSTSGVKLCARKQDKVTFNEAGLRRTGSPILLLQALHNNATARRASETKGQLPVLLPVARGAAVVLTSNLWPQMKLVNGSRGTLTYIVYEEGRGPGDGLPAFLVVTFPDYVGPPYVPGEPGTVPILTTLADWREGKIRCLRRMYPLILGYAITIHKSQGKYC